MYRTIFIEFLKLFNLTLNNIYDKTPNFWAMFKKLILPIKFLAVYLDSDQSLVLLYYYRNVQFYIWWNNIDKSL